CAILLDAKVEKDASQRVLGCAVQIELAGLVDKAHLVNTVAERSSFPIRLEQIRRRLVAAACLRELPDHLVDALLEARQGEIISFGFLSIAVRRHALLAHRRGKVERDDE